MNKWIKVLIVIFCTVAFLVWTALIIYFSYIGRKDIVLAFAVPIGALGIAYLIVLTVQICKDILED